MGSSIAFVGGALLMLFGAALLKRSMGDTVKCLASNAWLQTSGTILSARLREEHDPERSLYGAELSYEYFVEGNSYTSTNVRFGGEIALSWSQPADSLLRRYRPGDTVTVFFNPDKPSEAVLEPGVSTQLIAGLVLGLAFFLFGSLVLWLRCGVPFAPD